jgi:nicotinate dehydrogenase subunit A
MPDPISLTINGAARSVDADPSSTLLDVLRNDLNLKGARFGCGQESCGACMVLIDGQPRYSCTTTLDALTGKKITTIEGLGTVEAPHPVQAAFLDLNAGQCGYCLSGIIISAAALLEKNPKPSRTDIAEALDPHLCRCGAHDRIVKAVLRAAEKTA